MPVKGQQLRLEALTLVSCISNAGINSIMFYAPVIFATVSPANGALLSTVVTGAINVVATFLAIATVDRAGRRARPCCLSAALTGIDFQAAA